MNKYDAYIDGRWVGTVMVENHAEAWFKALENFVVLVGQKLIVILRDN